MITSHTQLIQEQATSLPAYRKLQRVFFAACMVLGPLMAILEVIFNPSIGAGAGSATIAANAAANAAAIQLHLWFGVAGSFLMPFGLLGMALLAMNHSPWLATIGGAIALLGFIPSAVFAGQESLTYDIAQMGGSTELVALWDRFNGDAVMTFYVLIFIVGGLLGPMLLGIALGRGQIIPTWAAWAIIIHSPLLVVAFVSHFQPVAAEAFTYSLLLLGSIPAAIAMLKFDFQNRPMNLRSASADKGATR